VESPHFASYRENRRSAAQVATATRDHEPTVMYQQAGAITRLSPTGKLLQTHTFGAPLCQSQVVPAF